VDCGWLDGSEIQRLDEEMMLQLQFGPMKQKDDWLKKTSTFPPSLMIKDQRRWQPLLLQQMHRWTLSL